MTSDLLKGPAVVGTIHSPTALREALRLRENEVDLLEVRVDHFVTNLKPLVRALPQLRFPLILTVRHPLEGGASGLPSSERISLYQQFLDHAALIDVELRSASRLKLLLQAAQDRGVVRILSWHDFRSTPPLASLQRRWSAAAQYRPQIIKFATTTQKPKHLATLVSFLATRPASPQTSLMGMGPFGKISRLTLAAAGSCLNYGYLGEQQLSGQWSAKLLKQRLLELR
jgi:3-dehydroquinate dehydratase-1